MRQVPPKDLEHTTRPPRKINRKLNLSENRLDKFYAILLLTQWCVGIDIKIKDVKARTNFRKTPSRLKKINPLLLLV